MEIDHIFIFSNSSGKEADQLVEFGFSEGSSRIHPGQGTINRKFYFENFFLEILWVNDVDEINSPITAPTRLWERSLHKTNHSSPFGLCLVNTEQNDMLFQNSLSYQPKYFPKKMSIDVLTNSDAPFLPWTFRLPFKKEEKSSIEPTMHQNGIRKLSRVIFEIPDNNPENEFIRFFSEEDHISFETNTEYRLILEFDKRKKGLDREFEDLGLVIRY